MRPNQKDQKPAEEINIPNQGEYYPSFQPQFSFFAPVPVYHTPYIAPLFVFPNPSPNMQKRKSDGKDQETQQRFQRRDDPQQMNQDMNSPMGVDPQSGNYFNYFNPFQPFQPFQNFFPSPYPAMPLMYPPGSQQNFPNMYNNSYNNMGQGQQGQQQQQQQQHQGQEGTEDMKISKIIMTARDFEAKPDFSKQDDLDFSDSLDPSGQSPDRSDYVEDTIEEDKNDEKPDSRRNKKIQKKKTSKDLSVTTAKAEKNKTKPKITVKKSPKKNHLLKACTYIENQIREILEAPRLDIDRTNVYYLLLKNKWDPNSVITKINKNKKHFRKFFKVDEQKQNTDSAQEEFGPRR